MPTLNIWVPGKPVPKQSARFGRKGAYQPARVTNYRTLVASAVHNAIVTQTEDFVQLAGPVGVVIDAYWPWPKRTKKSVKATTAYKTTRPDTDNISKAILDACYKVWADDAQVCDLHVRKWYAPEDQVGVHVRIEAI